MSMIRIGCYFNYFGQSDFTAKSLSTIMSPLLPPEDRTFSFLMFHLFLSGQRYNKTRALLAHRSLVRWFPDGTELYILMLNVTWQIKVHANFHCHRLVKFLLYQRQDHLSQYKEHYSQSCCKWSFILISLTQSDYLVYKYECCVAL